MDGDLVLKVSRRADQRQPMRVKFKYKKTNYNQHVLKKLTVLIKGNVCVHVNINAEQNSS